MNLWRISNYNRYNTKSDVKVFIYNIQGEKIRKLMDAKVSTGEYTMTWDGKNDWGETTQTGTYIVSFIINGQKVANTKIIKKSIRF